MQDIRQLSGVIPIQQYVGSGNERHAAALREFFIDNVSVKTCRAARPTGWWQFTYHSVVIRSGSWTPEYGTKALGVIQVVHKTRVERARELRLENLPAPWTQDNNPVAIVGNFTRSSGDIDNVHLYHFTHKNSVNWVLAQAVVPVLPLNLVPDPESWRYIQGMYVKLGDLLR